MSENPDGELFTLGVDLDTSAAQQQFDEFIAHIESKQAEAMEAFGKGNDAAFDFVKDLQGIKEAAFQGTEGLEDLRKEIDFVAESFLKLSASKSGQAAPAFAADAYANFEAYVQGTSKTFDEWNLKLNQTFEEWEQINGLAQETSEITSGLAEIEPVIPGADAFANLEEYAQGTSSTFDEWNAKLNQTFEEWERLNEVAQETADITAQASGNVPGGSAYLGYGTEGGLIGPADENGPDLGSSYSLGRGARAIGQLTGQQGAGNAVADVLYIRQAIEQLGGVFEAFNVAVEASPGLLAPLVSGFEALGIPMAGIAAVAVPVAAGIAAVAGAIVLLKSKLDEGKAEVEQGLSQLDKFYNLIGKGLTSSEIEDLRAKDQDQKGLIERQLQEVEAAKNAALAGGLEKGPLGVAEVVASGAYQAILAREEDLKKQLAGTEAAIGADTAALHDQATAANDAAAASRAQADAVAQQAHQFASDDKLSTDAAKDRITVLKDDIAAQRSAIDILNQANQATGLSAEEYKKNSDAIDQHTQQLQNDIAEVNHLTNESLYLIAAREAEADAIKQTKKALEDLAKAQETGDKQAADLQTQTANQRETAALKEAQAEQQYTQGSIQDAFERSKIALAESRKEVDAKQAAADKIDDVMAKMDDDINKAYRDLAAKQTEDTIKAAEDLGKITREENYKEREDRIDHLNKLSDIAKKEKDSESDALYDRNFRELSKIQSHKDDAVKAEDDAYSAREAAEQRHTQDLINERNIRLNEEMAAQQRANALKIQEIQIAEREQETQITITEQRKITALRTGAQQQIQDLTTMEGYKIQLLRQGMQNELNLLQLQENQRMAIIRNTLYEAQLKATQSLPSIRPAGLYDSDGIREFDSGGSFNAGEKFIMSEGQNAERLDIGGHSYNVGGAALVYPLQGGSVANPGRDGGSRTPVTINVGPIYDARDPEKTAALIKDRVAVELGSYFGDH